MRKVWWKILIPIVLAAAVVVGIFWRTIATYLAPKVMLSAAISKTVSELEQRFENSPIQLIGSAYDENGRYDIAMNLNADNQILGDMFCDLNLGMDTMQNRFLLSGTVSSREKSLNLNAFWNQDFLAVSSDSLLQGSYYGITYDTFQDDIKQIPLLEYVITDEMITHMDESIQALRPDGSADKKQFAAVSKEDLHMLMLGIMALDAEVQQQSVRVDGDDRNCFKISFRVSAEQLQGVTDLSGVPMLSAFGEHPDGYIRASFYLYKSSVVRLDVFAEAGENLLQFQMKLGENAGTGELAVTGDYDWNGEKNEFSVNLETDFDGERYKETVNLTLDTEDEDYDAVFSYDYDCSTGETILRSGSEKAELMLVEEEKGFTVTTKDFSSVLRILGQEGGADISSGTLTVTGGNEIQVPEYKNLDRWTLEDLLTLLGNIGILFDLNIG